MKLACPIFLFILLCFFAVAFADEPLWTNQERAEKSDIVAKGQVLAVEDLGKIDVNGPGYNEKLMKAWVSFDNVMKGTTLFKKMDLTFSFSVRLRQMPAVARIMFP